MTVRLIYSIAIALIVSACGGGGGGGDTTNTTGNAGGNTATVLEGTWIKPCGLGIGEDPKNATTVYDVVALTFTNNVVDTSIENYSDSGCTTPAPVNATVTASAIFVIGNPVTTTGSLQATEIDTTTTTGTAVTSESYGIFYIVPNSSPTIFYLGDTLNSGNGTTALLRPNTLDMTRAFELK